MNDFYKALETKREGDISHYGVRGMRWGVRIDYDDKKDNQGRIISSKPTAVLEDAPDPKRANKRAVKLARAKMKEYGFENPENPSAIAGQKYEDFQKLIFAKKWKLFRKMLQPKISMMRLPNLSSIQRICICAPKSSWKLKSGQPRKEARNDKIL